MEHVALDNSRNRYMYDPIGGIGVKKLASAMVLGVGILALSGCVGGTTYGTGVTQEQQLLDDLEGMMSFGSKKRKARINYSARPDLVVPTQSAALPDPLEEEASTSNVDWPESPEERLARIRGEAEEADPRSGEISVEELRRKKTGIRISSSKNGVPEMDRDGDENYKFDSGAAAEKAKRLKAKYAYSKGPTRKYLTEPPIEYRQPLDTAPIGELGISEAEKEKRAEKAEKLRRQEEMGRWDD